MQYPPWWRLRKPERLQLEISRADGSLEYKSFVMEPGVTNDTWLYPWNDSDLARYFDADEGHWRQGSRPAITHLRLWATPFDWVSVVPRSITIEAVDALQLTGH